MVEEALPTVEDSGDEPIEVVELSEAEAAKQAEEAKEFESVHGMDPDKYQLARDEWNEDPAKSEYENNHGIPDPWWNDYFEVDLALAGGYKKYFKLEDDDREFCTQKELDAWAESQEKSWIKNAESDESPEGEFYTLEYWMNYIHEVETI